tara:strand:+ start:1581 stop:2114 length:534 start_codon:yes stop_codon:yes gene_type:complete
MAEETKTAKIPEGVTVETPKQSELKELPIPEFAMDPGLPVITNPHYTNNNKTELACVLLRPDGMATQEKGIPTDEKHPLYRDIRRQFSEDEIRHNTARQVRIQKSLQKAGEDAQAQQAREDRRAALWSIKSTFLDLPQVKGTEFKSLKRKLRSATSPEEAQAFGIAIIIKEAEKDGD